MPEADARDFPGERPRGSDNARPPAVWTPEDAANFLSATIKEAQRPLSDALKRQGLPYWVFGLVLLVMLSSTVICWLYLDQLLQKALHDNSRLASELRLAHDKYEKLLDSRNRTTGDLQAKYARAMESTLKLQGELARVKGEAEAARAAAARERREAENLRRKLAEAEADYKKRVRTLQADHEQALLQASKRSGRSKELQARVVELEGCKAELESQLAAMQKQLTVSAKRASLLQAQLEGLQQERDALRKQLDASQTLLRDLQGKHERK